MTKDRTAERENGSIYDFFPAHFDHKALFAGFFHPADDPDAVLQADEGQTLKGQYKIISISLDKCLIEDLRDNHKQSVTLDLRQPQAVELLGIFQQGEQPVGDRVTGGLVAVWIGTMSARLAVKAEQRLHGAL